jgi:hypothetical protein
MEHFPRKGKNGADERSRRQDGIVGFGGAVSGGRRHGDNVKVDHCLAQAVPFNVSVACSKGNPPSCRNPGEGLRCIFRPRVIKGEELSGTAPLFSRLK